MFTSPAPAAYPPHENMMDAAPGQMQYRSNTPMLFMTSVRSHPHTPRQTTPGRGASPLPTSSEPWDLRRGNNVSRTASSEMRRDHSFARASSEEPWELRAASSRPAEEPWELRASSSRPSSSDDFRMQSSRLSEELPWELRPDNGFPYQDGRQGTLHGRAQPARGSSPAGWAPSRSGSFYAAQSPPAMAPGDIQFPVFHASSPSLDPRFRPVSRGRGASPVHRVGSFYSAIPVASAGSPRPQAMRQESVGRMTAPVIVAQQVPLMPGQEVRRVMASQLTTPVLQSGEVRGGQQVMTTASVNSMMRKNSPELQHDPISPKTPLSMASTPSLQSPTSKNRPLASAQSMVSIAEAPADVQHTASASLVTHKVVPPPEEGTGRDRGRPTGSRGSSAGAATSQCRWIP